MADDNGARIALAREHVRKGRAIVARQRALIDRVRFADGATGKDEMLLALFERTLGIFEDDLARLEGRP